MRQAIEEGFILDVLKNYTTYKTLLPAGEGDRGRPEGGRSRRPQGAGAVHEPAPAQHRAEDRGDGRALPRSTSRTRSAAGRRRWWSPARACTPCATSRRSTSTSREKGYSDIGVLVAFSGTVQRPDVGRRVHRGRHEPGHHGEGAAGASSTRDEYQRPDRRQQVPDRLRPAAAAHDVRRQAPLRRSGRADAVAPQPHLPRQGGHLRPRLRQRGRGDPAAFQPYYESTTVAESADPQQLYDLQHELDAAQVFWTSEVEAFCKVFFKPKEKQTVARPGRDEPLPRPRRRSLQGAGRGRSRTSSARRSQASSTCTPSSRRSCRSSTATWRSSTPSAAS